ncbi:MAG: phosphohistidine phosphatase SixA [Defluviicoccus sp.]|nr:phosphohistidine phosphatase SixA [Defluviicoccus sp.]MDG4592854.1 phosphohistidine phosphatase SixA [Defluviicoccus sp.]MDS4010204.1 phosphohistidine phosphatase SixA [Defluviicoccus sp.]MDS4073506.1 phosphohistidine phosphatase SixA [Defluviicoccus sp.]
MRLYLIQHGEAVPEDIDVNRPLTATGRGDVERLAQFMKESGIRVDRVVCSDKLRARTSADILAAAVADASAIQVMEKGLLPKDSTEGLVDKAVEWKDPTLVVGHQPFMSRFVSRLVLGSEHPLVVDFVPGTAVCLVRRSVTGAWFINWTVTPELLRRDQP